MQYVAFPLLTRDFYGFRPQNLPSLCLKSYVGYGECACVRAFCGLALGNVVAQSYWSVVLVLSYIVVWVLVLVVCAVGAAVVYFLVSGRVVLLSSPLLGMGAVVAVGSLIVRMGRGVDVSASPG